MILGFENFDTPTPVTIPTTAELVASLTIPQRGAILNGFSDRISPSDLRKDIFIDEGVIAYIYARLIDIRDYSRRLCRGEIIDTPEVLDPETGEVITPATYVDAPTTLVGLKAVIQTEYSSEFTQVQSDIIVDKMVAVSTGDGDGTFSYYIAGVTA